MKPDKLLNFEAAPSEYELNGILTRCSMLQLHWGSKELPPDAETQRAQLKLDVERLGGFEKIGQINKKQGYGLMDPEIFQPEFLNWLMK